ncbi:hypothetical protein DUI87_07116 [Hirundo rustica rustica]|uniref:Mdm2-binding protein n=1 Tax=Hirundo rustica rustica TaxID=333673 RepID=A0A3M0KNX8_HIRRU|nr:hypothetical protein DUI87_07116 [Hirundo rustica rustica]
MDRYVLLLSWGERRAEGGPAAATAAAGTAADMYQFLKESCNASINADVSIFPACSVAGIPGVKKWYFASHVICGYYQFCSSDWEEINADAQKNEDSHQASIDENLGTTQNFEEDDSNSQESLSLTEYVYFYLKNSDLTSNIDDQGGSRKFNNIYDEAAESLHQLADKLPAPGRAMVDVILQAVECDGPKLKDCLPVVGALKHLREWHSAQITIAASDAKGSWQKIADYLSADFVSSDDIMNIIDLNELWRGKIQIWERKEPVKKEYRRDIYTAFGPDFFSLWEVPEIELKGESCRYYFLLQGNGSGGCKATLIHSAGQINGMATLAAVNGKLKAKAEETESGFHISDFIKSLPCYCGEEIVQRETKLSRLQVFALKEYLKPDLIEPNPLEWPERHVLQNLENFEKNKQKMRVPLFARSSEQLLGHKDSQRESLTLLDAKELLKYFTPEGLPVGELQPLQVPKRENAFLLTRELTPRKLRGLPFEKAAGYHYHGLEYCLDNRRALERDVGYAELQTRLIRYETQTTCTKECCPVPLVLSPLPSPAVLSEPGSVPDGESLQSEFKTETSRLKRRSKDPDYFYPKKRLTKSESTDSLLSQASGSSRSQCAAAVTRKRSDRSAPVAAAPSKPPGQAHGATAKAASAAEHEASKPEKESRSQKHTRMLKEVVAKTLQKHGIAEDHKCFASCSQRLFEISKFYLKDLKTSRGLLDEMKKTARSNAKQVIEWVLEKTGK